MATAAHEVANVPAGQRDQAEAVLAALRHRIAAAMTQLGIGHENPKLIEAHVRFAVQFDATAPRLADLKDLTLRRMVADAQQEFDDRPDLVYLYQERADTVYAIPPFAYTDTELAEPKTPLPPLTAKLAREAGLL